jgi:hypothetical protein
VFIEIAGDGAGCEVVIEDGTVKGAEPVPTEEPAAPQPSGSSFFDNE